MARERMVTRTVLSTKVTCLTLDVQTAEPQNCTYEVAGTFPDDPKGNDKLLKLVRKQYETDTLKVVAIVAKETTEQLYGMSEQKFIEQAEVLPPRTAKEN